jgi:anti-sigma B factor antagonist
LHYQLSLPAPDSVRLAVTGEIDLATAPALALRLLEVMTRHQPTVVDVDLADVMFLDCYGIGVLVAVRDAAEKNQCRIWISNLQPMIAEILDVVGCSGCSPRQHGWLSPSHDAAAPWFGTGEVSHV